jgi:hypothetical protein
MELRPLLRFVYPFLCVLLQWQLPNTIQAEKSKARYSAERRYDHHKVDLEETKHLDEFFIFVTVSDGVPLFCSAMYRANSFASCSGPILTRRDGTLKSSKTMPSLQGIGSPRRTQMFVNFKPMDHGMARLSTMEQAN